MNTVCTGCNNTEIREDGTLCSCDGDGYCRECHNVGYCRECHNVIKVGQKVKPRYGDHGRAIHEECSK